MKVYMNLVLKMKLILPHLKITLLKVKCSPHRYVVSRLETHEICLELLVALKFNCLSSVHLLLGIQKYSHIM
jgi:hypothetical protein